MENQIGQKNQDCENKWTLPCTSSNACFV